MLKMVIADDEYLVREGLKAIIDWSKYNIEIIGFAKNGSEALSLCEDIQPDILLTDIRMPHMSGIEVITKLVEQGIETKTVILSGYDDFSYAKNAIELNVENYILKPIKIEELIKVITKVIDSIEMEKEHTVKFLELKEQLDNNLPTIKERFLTNLVFKKFADEINVYKRCVFLNIHFDSDQPYVVCKMIINEITGSFSNDYEENYELILMSILNVANELLEKIQPGVIFNLNDKEFIIIFNTKKSLAIAKFSTKLVNYLNSLLGVKASIGIGHEVNNILSLYNSLKLAENALEFQFYSGLNTVIDCKDIDKKSRLINYIELQSLEEKLLKAIKIGNSKNTKTILLEIFDYIHQSDYAPEEYTKSVFIELISITARSLFEIQENFYEIMGDSIEMTNKINRFDTYYELRNYAIELFVTLSDYFFNKLNQKNHYVINEIKEIINKQYMKKLTVQEIAKQIGFTPNYISQIFKKETGYPLTKYITKIRIEASKELLKDSNFKVFEVADMVGFDNPYYFSTVFKKITGIHPSKYR